MGEKQKKKKKKKLGIKKVNFYINYLLLFFLIVKFAKRIFFLFFSISLLDWNSIGILSTNPDKKYICR